MCLHVSRINNIGIARLGQQCIPRPYTDPEYSRIVQSETVIAAARDRDVELSVRP